MLEDKERLILSYIVGECGDNYKVIEKDDFEDFYKSKLGKKRVNLDAILTHLKNTHYVDIKYFDDNKYCLCATEQAKLLFEQDYIEKTKIRKIKLEVVILLIFVLFFAFIGSFLGTLLYNLIL